MKNRIWNKTIIFLVLAFFLGWEGVFAKSIPISVHVAIDVNALTSSWEADKVSEVLTDARKRLTKVLKDRHGHWDFRDDGKARSCSIKFSVVDPDPDDGIHEAVLKLELSSPLMEDEYQPVVQPWLGVEVFEYRRFPKSDEMAAKLEENFVKKFLDNRTVELRKWLQEHIALAESGKWLSPAEHNQNFKMVLSLPYETFKALEESFFLIWGKAEQGSKEKLKAQGLSQSAPYSPGVEGEQYHGLLVRADSIVKGEEDRTINAQALQFILGPVFLYKEETSRDSFVALFEEDGP